MRPNIVKPRAMKANTSGGVFPGSNGPSPLLPPTVLLDADVSDVKV